ncbi:hypothetical protein HZC31_07760 [Candidatus Woesearchaeota archaeon]|nr:hypothetical protein [Candidatus Woesearchaeota archaeon]
MTLIDVLNNACQAVGVPETEIRKGYVSHREQEGITYPNVLRMGRAWKSPPTERKISEDKIGTSNLGLPPVIATLMQELRERSVDPTNPEHVQKFQRGIAQVTQLVTPLLLTDILQRKYSLTNPAKVDCEIEYAGGTITLPYEEALARRIKGIKTRKDQVTTVSGYHSRATVADLNVESIVMTAKVPMDWIPREQRPLRVAFLAIHRGGILPSLVAADLAEEMGCEAYIIGVDAKRRSEGGAHSGRVVGIDLKKPDGYHSSSYSQLIANAYVFPANYEKPDVLVVVDPMLATGGSSKEAINGCLETLNLKPSDVYCSSFFAGGYRGLQTLHDAGFNVHIVSHDQLPLTKEDYIKPGLGDAGDKMSGIVNGQDVKDCYMLLKGMEHLIEKRALSMNWLESYTQQMTGRRIAA